MRFSIRDLLWLTLVVAIGLGWWVQQRKHQSEVRLLTTQVEWATERMQTWRAGAGVLSDLLRRMGRRVTWDLEGLRVGITKPDNPDPFEGAYTLEPGYHDPSGDPED